MTSIEEKAPYYDPFDFEIDDDPYPTWRRLRDEAPLYYNEKYNFYALSRHDDVLAGLQNWQDFESGKGTIVDIILNGIEVPPGVILFEDPPLHDLHRKMLARVFTPRRMEAVEPLAREFCTATLDPLVGETEFDFIAHLGAWMPMRTIGYLLGIPEEDQVQIRDNLDDFLNLKDGAPADVAADAFQRSYQLMAEYVEWRADHPADDLMTQLLNSDVEEPDGTTRRLTRTEVLTYTATIAGAGNETTTRLIGFLGQLLGDHPDQRREIVADHSLLRGAIEETLRYEAPSPVQARYVARDVTLHGQTVPAGSTILLINGSGNRDDRVYDDPDRFDIHRRAGHIAFGKGLHFCLGSALARMETRVAMEEVLKRWPDWEVDYSRAEKAHTASVRGWARMPVFVPA